MHFEALLQGTNFRPIEAKAIANELVEGQALNLQREPSNEHDENAIQVIEPDSQVFIGYVAKEVSVEIAPLLDAGAGYTCHTGIKMPAKKGFKWTLNIEVEDSPVGDATRTQDDEDYD